MALSKTTKDHEEIQRWAEARGAVPSEVASTESKGEPGILRFQFPNAPRKNDAALKDISWDEFFEKFDASNLELIYQGRTADGEESNFNKLIHPESEKKSSSGRRSASGDAKISASTRTTSSGGQKKSASPNKTAGSQKKTGSRKKAGGAKKSAAKKAGARKVSTSSTSGARKKSTVSSSRKSPAKKSSASTGKKKSARR